jgi:hypothetical protein
MNDVAVKLRGPQKCTKVKDENYGEDVNIMCSMSNLVNPVKRLRLF